MPTTLKPIARRVGLEDMPIAPFDGHPFCGAKKTSILRKVEARVRRLSGSYAVEIGKKPQAN